MTIKDYKDSSESNIEIIVKLLEDEIDPMGKVLYEGCLGDCPKKYDELNVDIVGRSWKAAQAGKVLYYLEHIEKSKEDKYGMDKTS